MGRGASWQRLMPVGFLRSSGLAAATERVHPAGAKLPAPRWALALPYIIHVILCPTSRERLLLASPLCQLGTNVDHIDWFPRLDGPGEVKAKGQMSLFSVVWTKDFLARMLWMTESQLSFGTLLLCL